MATKKKMLQAAAGNAGGAGLDITDVFSTYLYDGNSGTLTVNNSIDLSGEGGLVWIKNRDQTHDHMLIDTVRGGTKYLNSNATTQEQTFYTGPPDERFTFSSTGFSSTSSDFKWNNSNYDYTSWTWRKAPKFFTCLTYTGNSTNRTISHDLGSVPGMIVVKRTDNPDNWFVYHRSTGPTKGFYLNETYGQITAGYWQNTTPTATEFSIFDDDTVNATGGTYVAYLFAHNDGDGEFGPSGDQDIIKCGSWTGSGSSGTQVDLGFEPQWVMVKQISGSSQSGWQIFDVMRGMDVGVNTRLLANETGAESSFTSGNIPVALNATGFKVNNSYYYDTGSSFLFMAIRRGPLAQPESGTEVFSPNLASGYPRYPSGFTTDFVIQKNRSSGSSSAYSRLLGNNNLDPATTAQESASAWDWAQMTGSGTNFTSTNTIGWSWKRAPGYFDVVAYSGDGVAGRTVSHNLGVAPEMMWVKKRSGAESWAVYHKLYGGTHFARLNQTGAFESNSNVWDNTNPTASVFTVDQDTEVNQSGQTYISYLFSTLAGVSKVGSYTATGNTLNIDCGFTSGARFVLIKNTGGGNWYVYDTARGIVSGNDPALELNTTSAEDNQYDSIDPYSAGFTLTAYGASSPALNEPGETFIFYAIA